jgi:hypothetical protein
MRLNPAVKGSLGNLKIERKATKGTKKAERAVFFVIFIAFCSKRKGKACFPKRH